MDAYREEITHTVKSFVKNNLINHFSRQGITG
jgi:hypothetical protein